MIRINRLLSVILATLSLGMPVSDIFADDPIDLTTISEIQIKWSRTPEFPGGKKALDAWILKHLKYPVAAKKEQIEGKVEVEFIVEADGTLKDIRVPKRVNYYLDKEAVRLVKLMPKWKPALVDGEPVAYEYGLTINFNLNTTENRGLIKYGRAGMM